jgi:hypothetical protein
MANKIGHFSRGTITPCRRSSAGKKIKFRATHEPNDR